MMVKRIAAAPDRPGAMGRLGEALARGGVWPVRTSGAFLVRALADPDFASGNVDTGLIARKGEALMPPPAPSEEALRGAAWRLFEEQPAVAPALPGFRLNAPARRAAILDVDGTHVPVDFAQDAERWYMEVHDGRVRLTEGGQTFAIGFARSDGGAAGTSADGAILAPMPGRVIAVEVAEGARVAKGQKLLTLEAMKMEHALTAPFDGIVAALTVAAGAQVQVEALLARIEKAED